MAKYRTLVIHRKYREGSQRTEYAVTVNIDSPTGVDPVPNGSIDVLVTTNPGDVAPHLTLVNNAGTMATTYSPNPGSVGPQWKFTINISTQGFYMATATETSGGDTDEQTVVWNIT
jgi:hypothetical protein